MKVLILGITGSGKSSIAGSIAQALGLEVIEVDEEVIKLNSGLWPKDEKTIDKYMEATNDIVVEMDTILYVTSWLNKRRVVQFHQNGFRIIELHAAINKLLDRKIKRDNPAPHEIDRFKENHDGYYEVVNDEEIAPLISLSIDTSEVSSDEAREKILSFLGKITS